MKPHKLNWADVPWEAYVHGRFGSEDQALSDGLDTRRLSYVRTRLAPGQVSSPYHCHHASEEMFYVLEGRGRLRYADEERPIRAGDFIACPPGPDSAHQIVNDSSEPLVYLAVSTVEPIDVCEYPDSGKVLVRVRSADGTTALAGVYRKQDTVDYWDGEA